MSAPLVSIVCVTYNHEATVAETIDSFLMQETDFAIEVLIGEDCSTDRTREICAAYAEKHPQRVRVIISAENVGPQANYIRTLKEVRGRYIAYCEGDDYWTDPRKLQKQVDLMESDPDCALCFHKAVELKNGERREFAPAVPRPRFSIDDLFLENFLRSCTVLYRNVLRGDYPDWFYDLEIGDWAFHILHAQHGYVAYMDESMACYRVHTRGTWGSGGAVVNLEKMIRFCELMLRAFPRSVHKGIPALAIRNIREELVRYCLIWGNRPFYGRAHLLKTLFSGGMPAQTPSQFVRLVFWTLMPWGGVTIKRLKGTGPVRSLT